MEYGRYRILHPLGQGGMATVHLAEDPLLQRLVAIKVIQAHLSSNSSLMDRFTVEAKTIASLRHVNIVEVFDFGVQDDQQYLVMEYIDGQNLQAMCAVLQGRPMDNSVAAAIICQAAEGLTSAEKHGVVHRDIKPENLMFNSEGQLKIADFGIAHIADEQSRTQTGAVLGSPNFMSPEQIEGLRPTHKTDLFSLGGVFFYCLTGKLPFTGPSIPVTMRNICDKPHPSILDLNPGADPFLVQLTDLLLQKQPEARAESARWLANQLRAWLNHQGVVDIADHCKVFIGTLGLGQNQTMVGDDGGSRTGLKPTKGSGSSLAGIPSNVIKTGSTLGAGLTQSRSLAGPSQFNTQATTGAMGPSSRSPLVWVGALLSLCVLVLAGAILWTRLDRGQGVDGAKVSSRLGADLAGAGQTKTPITGTANSTQEAHPQTVQPITANPIQETHATTGNPTHLATQTGTSRPDPGNIRPEPTGTQTILPPRDKSGIKTVKSQALPPDPGSAIPPKVPEPAGQNGYILIKSAPPFAALTINGKPQGETPMNAYLEVPLGRCQIEIVHRLSPPFDTILNITPGFRGEYKFKLDR
ncbi:MAG TPA: serine/threonine-protein kinase [Fibrobacteria bacterium]|nr:serine/threonine-protein kinase [Fibrobacteria bacterium]